MVVFIYWLVTLGKLPNFFELSVYIFKIETMVGGLEGFSELW